MEGKKDIVKAHAEARGQSVNAFISEAIDAMIQRNQEGGANNE